jgi:hypothetical protein
MDAFDGAGAGFAVNGGGGFCEDALEGRPKLGDVGPWVLDDEDGAGACDWNDPPALSRKKENN